MKSSPAAGRRAASSPRAVLFDFDGVIADTENVHIAAWERTFALMGWTVSPDLCAKAAEIDDREFLADVFARRRIEEGDLAGWVRRKQQFTVSMLTLAPRVCPGVAALVAQLAGRARLAVVSSTWRENVKTVLAAAGLDSAFDLLIGKEDVKRVKPDPSAYLLALEKLRLKGSQAVALEDSATGMHAAHAAGLRCVVVGKGGPPPSWIGKMPYLPDLTDAAETLRALGAREAG